MEKREKKFLLITICLLVMIVIGILIVLFGGTKSSSIMIDVKEEIPLPISIVLECYDETIVLYESDSIVCIEEEFPNYSVVAEGTIWMLIGDEKYEILSYIDYADRPIIEITGDDTSLEVLAYTELFQDSTLFQIGQEISQTTTITIQE